MSSTTLETDLATPHGIYRAGLRVRVLAATTDTLTIDLSPEGMTPRRYDIPRRSREWNPKTRHGTVAGFRMHTTLGHDSACEKCRLAWNHAQSVRRMVARRSNSVMVPIDAFAELYLAAAPDAQIRAERQFGDRLVRAIVARHDAQPVSA